MELSRQMLLLAAENYGSYYLHITMYYLLGEITFFNQNRSLENKQILFYCRADWLYW